VHTGAWTFAFNDALAAAHRAAANLGEAIKERTAGRPAGIDLRDAAKQLDRIADQLVELLDSAIATP
jgi:hypothetical protein